MRRLKGASLGTLQSGHSHEDIDQMFSSLATHIRNESELHCPSDFVQSIQSWLDQPQTRPSEKFKRCFKLDQVRAWKAQLHQLFENGQLRGVGGPGAPHWFEFSRLEDTGTRGSGPVKVYRRTESWTSFGERVVIVSGETGMLL